MIARTGDPLVSKETLDSEWGKTVIMLLLQFFMKATKRNTIARIMGYKLSLILFSQYCSNFIKNRGNGCNN